MGATPEEQPSVASDKVSWGPSTYAGYGVASVAFVLALIAFLGGDRSEQVIGVLVPGVIGGLSFAITQVGRYVQAKAKIDAAKYTEAVNAVLAPVDQQPLSQPDLLGLVEATAALVDRLREPTTITRREWTAETAPVVAAATGGGE